MQLRLKRAWLQSAYSAVSTQCQQGDCHVHRAENARRGVLDGLRVDIGEESVKIPSSLLVVRVSDWWSIWRAPFRRRNTPKNGSQHPSGFRKKLRDKKIVMTISKWWFLKTIWFSQNSKCYSTQKLKLLQNSKTQNGLKLENSVLPLKHTNCDQTKEQQLKGTRCLVHLNRQQQFETNKYSLLLGKKLTVYS